MDTLEYDYREGEDESDGKHSYPPNRSRYSWHWATTC